MFTTVEIFIAVKLGLALEAVHDLIGWSVFNQVLYGGTAGIDTIIEGSVGLIGFGLLASIKKARFNLARVGQGSSPPRPPRLIGRHGSLTNHLKKNGLSSTHQSHHLNQDAAFGKDHGGSIPYNEGSTVALRGGTNIIGSEHYLFHQKMDEFWRPYQRGGTKYGQHPTCAEYHEAVKESLTATGMHPVEVESIANLAREQRRLYGHLDDLPVPNIPK